MKNDPVADVTAIPRYWATGNRFQILCSVLTFIFMMAGWLATRLGVAWHDVFYIGAYLAGGYFGIKAGLRSLQKWTIDIDLLMILAAIGAAIVGAPFEGAMLLFLFSLSNVLQAYAMDRTRKEIGPHRYRFADGKWIEIPRREVVPEM